MVLASGPPVMSRRQQYVVAILAAVVVGAVFAPIAFNATDDGPDGTVAVVEFDGPVVTSSAEDVETELREIRQNDSVEAVVLKIDTPGGSPAASEQMYTSVQRTAQEMPVIASVQEFSASGGYYAMLPADDIYVLPTSITGSVGVNAFSPEPRPPVEGPTGPDKVGSNQIQSQAQIQLLANIFIDTVMAQRGDEIEISRQEVSYAKTYTGVTAVDNGFADEIGDLDSAIDAAATEAGLESYEVDVRETGESGFPILLRTDTGLVAVHDENPSYGDVETFQYAMVYEEAIPHVDEVDGLVSDDVVVENATTAGSDEAGVEP